MSDENEAVARRRAPRRFVKPIVYEVGKDLSHERYNEILVALTDWIREKRPAEKEPGTYAKLRFDECLNGTKMDGSPWLDMDTASLNKRVRSKLNYDIDKMQPMRTASQRTRAKKQREKDRIQLKRAAKRNDPLLPNSLREKLRKEFAYGDDPGVFRTDAEDREWHRIRDAYVEEFPELGTINGEAELNALCDVHIEMARYRAKRAAKEKVDPEMEAGCVKRLVDMKKALGIHPEQLARRNKTKTEFSVAEAVLRLEGMGDKWYEVRDQEAMEEFLQIYKMYHTPNATGAGYQLDEVGLFALTRCRPIPCPNCGTTHVFGLPIEMIEEWLLRRNVLEPEEVEEVEDAAVSEPDTDIPADQVGQTDPVDSGPEDRGRAGS